MLPGRLAVQALLPLPDLGLRAVGERGPWAAGRRSGARWPGCPRRAPGRPAVLAALGWEPDLELLHGNLLARHFFSGSLVPLPLNKARPPPVSGEETEDQRGEWLSQGHPDRWYLSLVPSL